MLQNLGGGHVTIYSLRAILFRLKNEIVQLDLPGGSENKAQEFRFFSTCSLDFYAYDRDVVHLVYLHRLKSTLYQLPRIEHKV